MDLLKEGEGHISKARNLVLLFRLMKCLASSQDWVILLPLLKRSMQHKSHIIIKENKE